MWGATKLASVLAEPRSTTKMRATLPGGSQMARAVAAETVKQLEQMPHGGGCVVGWWQLVLEHGWGPAGAKPR